jgi:hypothetical protein
MSRTSGEPLNSVSIEHRGLAFWSSYGQSRARMPARTSSIPVAGASISASELSWMRESASKPVFVASKSPSRHEENAEAAQARKLRMKQIDLERASSKTVKETDNEIVKALAVHECAS